MTPPPPLTERDLAFLEWLRGRGNLTVTKACALRRQRTAGGLWGGRLAPVKVFHTGGNNAHSD